MKISPVLTAVCLGALCAPLPSQAQAQDPKLKKVLDQMDKASASFKSATADFNKDLYEALVKQHTPQTGSIYVLRVGAGLQMGAKITGDGAETVEYKGGTIKLFHPRESCFEKYDTSSKAGAESFLTLGFGGSGKDLAKNWNITDQGSEKIGDTAVEKLDLVAKDPSARSNFTHVTLWVDAERGVSLKQMFFTPSGDTQTAVYSNIKMNQTVNTKPFEITGNACSK